MSQKEEKKPFKLDPDPFERFSHSNVDFAREIGEDLLLSSQVAAKKRSQLAPGHLFLTSERIVWCPSGSVTPAISILLPNVANHQYSPASQPKVLLKLSTSQNESFVFEFTSPTMAQRDRSAFREVLSQVRPPIKAEKKPKKESSSPSSSTATTKATSTTKSNTKIKTEPNHSRTNIVPEVSQTNNQQSSNEMMNVDGISVHEARERAHLLATDSQVKLLHAELVDSNIISEEEFWQARKDDIQNIALRPRQQQRGTPSTLLADLEPAARSATREHYRLTPALIRAIFTAQPAVKQTYEALVPEKLTEQQFWKKYLAARHFHRDRQKSAQRRVRTKSTAEDDMLTRALESSEHPPATIDESRRADVPLSVDIGADDSVLDTEHYGQREDALMRATPDANTAAVIARFNRHSALVLESETETPSVVTMIRPRDTTLRDDDKEVDEDDDALRQELQPTSAADIDYIALPHNDTGATARTAPHTDASSNAAAALTATLDSLRLDTFALTSPAPSECARVIHNNDTALQSSSAAVSERSRARHAGGATMNEIYQLADQDNCRLLKDLDISDDMSAKFRRDIYNRFARVNELLRHFWRACPPRNNNALAKIQRIASALARVYDETEQYKSEIPSQYKGRLIPILIVFMARIDVAIDVAQSLPSK